MHDHAPHPAAGHDGHDGRESRAETGPHPLLWRLETVFGYPRLRSQAEVEAFLARPGAHCCLLYTS
ncbi:MAG: hypothetical protein N2422_13085, partial [Rhodobacteraceae bacterium]|nr:hypothetical protein [Paracoccaceae bacterium]